MLLENPEELGFSVERSMRLSQLMERYIKSGKLAGIDTCVFRFDRVVQREIFGSQNLESNTPLAKDSIFRIYSMTKPITSVALMMLFEESLFNLTDPLSNFIPAFNNVKVLGVDGSLEDPLRPITVHDILCHTAGLSYGGYDESLASVDKLYDEADLSSNRLSNSEFADRVANLPLMYHPGTKWHYSVATDIAGHLVEIIADTSLGDFMQEKIFGPLGMIDTAFHIEPSKLGRFCTLYGKTKQSDLGVIDLPETSDYLPPVQMQAGGSGLISTTDDYLQFARCLLNKGELEGVRLLGSKTLDWMTSNHLAIDLLPIAYEGFEPMFGMGFGLGFGVMLNPAAAGIMGSIGDFGWGGYAETYFWVDPQEKLIAILMTQYQPSQTYPIRKEFRTAVYQALIS
jgi:CubicO group peptidase (beta-lactamase class C family)